MLAPLEVIAWDGALIFCLPRQALQCEQQVAVSRKNLSVRNKIAACGCPTLRIMK